MVDYEEEFDRFIDAVLLKVDIDTDQTQDVEAIRAVDENEAERRLFIGRTIAIKKLQHIAENRLWIRFSKELNFSKVKVYPTKWMLKKVELISCFKHYSYLLPILNHVYNHTRYDGAKVTKLIDKSDGHYFYKGYPMACFKADKKFYADLCRKVGCSKRTAQRYIKELVEIGVLKIVEVLPHNVQILSDGYYVPWNGKQRKVPFLRANQHFTDELANFYIPT